MEPLTPCLTLHEHVFATAAQRGDALAVSAAGGDWSWADLARHVRLAASALSGQGLQGGDRLVIVSENSPTTLVLLLAAQAVRAWPAVVNARMPPAEIDRLLDCAQPRLVLFSLEESSSVEELAEAYGAGTVELPQLGPLRGLQRTPTIPPAPPSPNPSDEIGSLIFTSGTTGKPKAVMISHAGMLNHGRVVGAARGTRADDVIDVAAPLSHVMGHASVLAALLHGAALRIRPRLAPSELVQAMARGEVAQASMVPVAWVRLLDQIEAERIDLSRHALRTLVSGGAPLDPELKARIERTFGRPMQNAYGMTEVAPLARSSITRPSQPWSVGQPEANVEVRIVDGQGHPVAPGEIGEIQARGPSVMKGYFGNPEATAEVMREGGWYATGDLGRWLPDGDFAVVGRAKEMIIRSGFNVYPAEVEAAIGSHGSVLHAAVVGEPAEHGNETIVAYVQLRDPAQSSPAVFQALESHVRSLLAPYKCPSHFEFVTSMPLGTTGKILKRELRRAVSQD